MKKIGVPDTWFLLKIAPLAQKFYDGNFQILGIAKNYTIYDNIAFR
jgi:hypothetical protein